MALIENPTVKFFFIFILLVVLPVWIFNLIPISFLWKVGFTIAGGVGAYLAVSVGTLKLHR